MRSLPFVFLAVAPLAACQSSSEVCTADLRFAVTPARATLRVGATETFRATAAACSGTQQRQYTYRWSSSDTTVVGVDSLTGAATARAGGVATVAARPVEYHVPVPQASARVTVTP